MAPHGAPLGVRQTHHRSPDGALHLTCKSGYNVAVRESGVRLFRRPPRVEPHGRDLELAALVANVPGAIYRCALDADWTMAVISATSMTVCSSGS